MPKNRRFDMRLEEGQYQRYKDDSRKYGYLSMAEYVQSVLDQLSFTIEDQPYKRGVVIKRVKRQVVEKPLLAFSE